MIRIITLVSLTGLFAIFSACSGIPDLSAKKDEGSSPENNAVVADQDQPCAGEGCDSKTEESSFGTLGLAGHCEYSKEDAKGCFVCTPRDLPRKMCVDVDADFDPAKSCEYDLDVMTCKVKGDAEDFEFDFSEQTQIEKIYSKIPFLLLGAKVLIGSKLKDQPKMKELLFASFDSVLAHKKAAFTNGDLGPLFDEIGAHVKKAKPDLDDAKIKTIKEVMLKAAAVLSESYADGKMDDGDFLLFAHSLLSAFPPELLGNVLEQLDIEKILASLQASGNQDIIDELINTAGGSTGDVVSGIEGSGDEKAP